MRFPRLASAALLAFSCSFAPIVAAAAVDPVSGLPLFPGATVSQAPRSQEHCGITMRSVQYEVDEATRKPVDFFREALPDASSWTVAIMTAFLTPNGRTIVKVLSGAPHSYVIVYGTYSKPVTVLQVRKGAC